MNVGNRFDAVLCTRKDKSNNEKGLSPYCQSAVLAQHKLADDEQRDEESTVHNAEEAKE